MNLLSSFPTGILNSHFALTGLSQGQKQGMSRGDEKWRKVKWREVSRGEVEGRKEKMGRVKFSFM